MNEVWLKKRFAVHVYPIHTQISLLWISYVPFIFDSQLQSNDYRLYRILIIKSYYVLYDFWYVG